MRLNGKKNMTPPSAPYSKRVSRLAPLKVCERNNVSGTIGAELRASTSRKPSSATTPITRAPSTRGVPTPREPASSSPYTSAPNPSVTSSVPHQSSLPEADGSRLSGTRQNRTTSTTTASGTLIKNTQRQEAYWTNTPPSTGPTTVVSAENPDQVPKARPRCSSLKEALIIAKLPGTRRGRSPRANNALITGRFHESGHGGVFSRSRIRSLRFLVVPTLVVYHLFGTCQRSRLLFSSESPKVIVFRFFNPVVG